MLVLRKQLNFFFILPMIAKENMAFTKMQYLCAIDQRHGVDIGTGCKKMTNHVLPLYTLLLMSRRKVYKMPCQNAGFFSLQADGTTDTSNISSALFQLMQSAPGNKFHVRNVYFSLNHLGSGK